MFTCLNLQHVKTSGEGLFSAAVLYARKNSIYKQFNDLDVYDQERDAFSFNSNLPVIAHPPCRLWGKLKHQSKAPLYEKYTALHAVTVVQQNGGVIEHPAFSKLWHAADLPFPQSFDKYGGFTLPIYQSWFGHKADKPTWLYFVGLTPSQLPALPFHLGKSNKLIRNSGSMLFREGTPLELAKYLSACCRIITINQTSLLNNKRSLSNGLDFQAKTC